MAVSPAPWRTAWRRAAGWAATRSARGWRSRTRRRRSPGARRSCWAWWPSAARAAPRATRQCGWEPGRRPGRGAAPYLDPDGEREQDPAERRRAGLLLAPQRDRLLAAVHFLDHLVHLLCKFIFRSSTLMILLLHCYTIIRIIIMKCWHISLVHLKLLNVTSRILPKTSLEKSQ